MTTTLDIRAPADQTEGTRSQVLRASIGITSDCGLRVVGRLDPTQHIAGCDVVLLRLEDLPQYAARRCGHLDSDLVGLELDQRLVRRHGVANRLEPAQDLRADR